MQDLTVVRAAPPEAPTLLSELGQAIRNAMTEARTQPGAWFRIGPLTEHQRKHFGRTVGYAQPAGVPIEAITRKVDGKAFGFFRVMP